MKIKQFALFLFALLLLGACTKKQSHKIAGSFDQSDSTDFAFSVEFKFAQKVKVTNLQDHKELQILSPTDTNVVATYILALQGVNLPKSITDKGVVIRVPVKNICCLSTTHVGAMELLGLQDKVIGGTSIDKFWSAKIQERVLSGELKEVGKGMVSNLEQIIALRPSLVTTSDHSLEKNGADLAAIGITPVYNNDWRESSLLGRAEWMKVMALFFCKSVEADSMFNATVQRYYGVVDLAKTAKKSPKVFVGQETRGTWYIPGSESYVSAMIRDANGSMYGVPGERTNYPCSFEKAYAEHHDAEYWFTQRGSNIKTIDEFSSASEHYKKFKAYQLGNVFINNKRLNERGGNDFWESGVYHPDLVLKDLVKIIHPDLDLSYETIYWRRLD